MLGREKVSYPSQTVNLVTRIKPWLLWSQVTQLLLSRGCSCSRPKSLCQNLLATNAHGRLQRETSALRGLQSKYQHQGDSGKGGWRKQGRNIHLSPIMHMKLSYGQDTKGFAEKVGFKEVLFCPAGDFDIYPFPFPHRLHVRGPEAG